MRAIVVSDEFRGTEHGLVATEQRDVADVYLHHDLKQRVDGTEGVKKQCVDGLFGGLLNRVQDVGLLAFQLVTLGNGTKVINGSDKSSILHQRTTYTRIERQLVKLARQQNDLIHKMANDVNLAHGEHAMKAVIKQSDKLKGFNRDADPLSGIVGPTQAVYKRYKSDLDGIASGKFTQFFEKNGCERLHLFDLDTARTHFKRWDLEGRGDAVIEENVYVLHPKLDGVLVPIATYHENLLAELDQEFVVALGKLGAKSLTIETVAGMTCSLGADTKISKKMKKKKPASGSARYEKGENKELKVWWGSPTYDPDHAMDGCCLVQDKIGDKTLLQLRKTSDVVTYEKNYSIDTTFGVDIKVVQLIDASFKWEARTQYKLVVEFFSKKEIESESKAKEDEVQSATRAGSESV